MTLSFLYTLAIFSDIGGMEIVVIGAIALLLFGKNLPTVSRNIGKAIAEFKKVVSEASGEIKKEMDAAAHELEKAQQETARELPTPASIMADDKPLTPAIPDSAATANGNGSGVKDIPATLTRSTPSSPSSLDTFNPDAAQAARPPVI